MVTKQILREAYKLVIEDIYTQLEKNGRHTINGLGTFKVKEGVRRKLNADKKKLLNRVMLQQSVGFRAFSRKLKKLS